MQSERSLTNETSSSILWYAKPRPALRLGPHCEQVMVKLCVLHSHLPNAGEVRGSRFAPNHGKFSDLDWCRNLRQRREDLRSSSRVKFQPNPIIDCIVETLFAAQVLLRRLYRDMSQRGLNLLEFAAGLMAKAGASPAKLVRCARRNLT